MSNPLYTGWPIAPANVPMSGHPKALDWSYAGRDSVMIPLSANERRFVTKNLRKIFAVDLVYNSGDNSLLSATRVGEGSNIPVCWTSDEVIYSAPISFSLPFKARLGVGMDAWGTKIFHPLGTRGEKGIATYDGISGQWAIGQVNLKASYGYALSDTMKFNCRLRACNNWIFISQGSGGIAVYNHSLEWQGHLPMPRWDPDSTGSNVNLKVYDIQIKQINSRAILAVSVAAIKLSTTGTYSPKVLFYDADAIVAGDLRTTYAFGPATPTGTAVPLGVVFEKNPHTQSPGRPQGNRRVDIGPAPGSSVALTPSGTHKRILCATGNDMWAGVHDITHLVIDNTVADPAEPSCSEAHTYGSVSDITGLDIPASTLCTICPLDTFAISSGPWGNCGPPKYSRTTMWWPLLMPYSSGRSVTLGGKYLALGHGGNPSSQGNGLHLLAMDYGSNFENFNMAKIGIAQPQLGMGGQDETYARFQFDPAHNWFHGCFRAASGWTGFQLPPNSDAAALINAVQTPNGSGLAFESQDTNCSVGGLSYDFTVNYLEVDRMQAVPLDFYGGSVLPVVGEDVTISWTTPLVPATWQLPANLTGYASWNIISPPGYPGASVPPSLEEINSHGGFEILGGTRLTTPVSISGGGLGAGTNTLFFADRSSHGVYAFSESPENSVMLGASGHLPGAADVAVGPSASADSSIVCFVGPLSPYIKAQYWDENNHTFGAPIGIVPLHYPLLTSPVLGGVQPHSMVPQGFRRIQEIRTRTAQPTSWDDFHLFSSTNDNPVSHIMACWNGRMKSANYPDRFDIAITPIADIDNGFIDSDNLITTVSTYWRFKRNAAGTGTKVIIDTDGNPQEVEKGMLEVWDVAQVGNYVLAWVNEYDSITEEPVAHHVAVLKLVWTLETGTDPSGNSGYRPQEVITWTNQGEPAELTGAKAILSLEQINLVKLTDYQYHIHDEAEGNRINVSPKGKFAVATGGSAAGAYLLYLGADPRRILPGYPKVVGGLHYNVSPTDSSIKWRGWPLQGGGLVSDELATITSDNRAGCKPQWPLDGSPQKSFKNFPSNTAAFHESNDSLFLFLQTEPMSVWWIDQAAAFNYASSPTYDSSTALDATQVLHFVAALNGIKGRFREVITTLDHIYWVGDGGAVSVPTLSSGNLLFNTCGQG